jgi:hypothetical protein
MSLQTGFVTGFALSDLVHATSVSKARESLLLSLYFWVILSFLGRSCSLYMQYDTKGKNELCISVSRNTYFTRISSDLEVKNV